MLHARQPHLCSQTAQALPLAADNHATSTIPCRGRVAGELDLDGDEADDSKPEAEPSRQAYTKSAVSAVAVAGNALAAWGAKRYQRTRERVPLLNWLIQYGLPMVTAGLFILDIVSDILVTTAFWRASNFQLPAGSSAQQQSTKDVILNRTFAVLSLLLILIPLVLTAVFITRSQVRPPSCLLLLLLQQSVFIAASGCTAKPLPSSSRARQAYVVCGDGGLCGACDPDRDGFVEHTLQHCVPFAPRFEDDEPACSRSCATGANAALQLAVAAPAGVTRQLRMRVAWLVCNAPVAQCATRYL
jgi:hypothetical protein